MRDKSSYMELCMHIDQGDDLYLRVPTVWDAIKKQWIGFIKTPKSKKIISATGKDSFELQNEFNIVISKHLHDDATSEEVFSMFKPLKEWENN